MNFHTAHLGEVSLTCHSGEKSLYNVGEQRGQRDAAALGCGGKASENVPGEAKGKSWGHWRQLVLMCLTQRPKKGQTSPKQVEVQAGENSSCTWQRCSALRSYLLGVFNLSMRFTTISPPFCGQETFSSKTAPSSGPHVLLVHV